MRIGADIRVRIGALIGTAGSAADPMDGVTADATSGKYIPADAAEWDTAVAAAGLADGPTSLWLFHDETDNTVSDVIGSRPLSLNGSITKQVAVAGWTSKSIQPHENSGSDYGVSSSGPDIGTTSALMLMYLQVTSDPGGNRSLTNIGGGKPMDAFVVAGGFIRAVADANTATGVNVPSGVIPLVVQYNRAASQFTVYTDTEKLRPTFAAANSTVDFYIPGGYGNSTDAKYVYAALFEGTAAELSDAEVKTLLETLGWTIAWS